MLLMLPLISKGFNHFLFVYINTLWLDAYINSEASMAWGMEYVRYAAAQSFEA